MDGSCLEWMDGWVRSIADDDYEKCSSTIDEKHV